MSKRNDPITGLEKIYSVSGYISYPLSESVYFKLAKLTYEKFEDESYQYVFEPFYDVLDGLPEEISIPGIDFSFKRKKYYRVNFIPVFISDRTFPSSRVEARKLLSEKGLKYYNPMEWLIDSKYRYIGDKLLLKSDKFYKNMKKVLDSKNIYIHIISILQRLGMRKNFSLGNEKVTNKNRASLINVYMNQYSLVEKHYYEKLKKNKGRKRIEVSIVELKEVIHLLDNDIISIKDAMKRLNIDSRATLYRRISEYRKQNTSI